MKKKSYEFITLISIVLFLTCGIGVAIGFSFGAQFPKTDWAAFASTIAQVLAVIGTIAGAYILATKQKRDSIREREKRVLFLVSNISTRIEIACEEAKEKLILKREDANSINELIDVLDNLPVEIIPVYFLDDHRHFIKIVREAYKELDYAATYGLGLKDTTTFENEFSEIKNEISTAQNLFLESIEKLKHLH